MNPLLFADWGRMNRIFIRVMWAVAAALVCAVCIAATAATPRSHAAAPATAARVASPPSGSSR
jgi:hypothetical protein